LIQRKDGALDLRKKIGTGTLYLTSTGMKCN